MIKNYIEQFLFFPSKEIRKTPSDIELSYETIKLEHENDIYCGWFIQGTYKNTITKNKCIMLFNGNSGNSSFRLNYLEKLSEIGFSILMFDYPGFGNSTGIPNEKSCVKCANLFYNHLISENNFFYKDIIFYGESIGGSIATSLALLTNIKYLIVQSTFTDIKDIIKNILSFDILMINNIGFETLENLKIRHKLNKINKKMKTMVIHSDNDELIDISHGNKLSKYSDVYYKCSGSHSNVTIDSAFIFNLLSFIKE